MLNKSMDKLIHMSFNKKIQLFLSITIIITTLIIMIVATISYSISIKDKSKTLVQRQIQTISNNLQIIIKDYYDTAISFNMDRYVQKYLKDSGLDRDNYYINVSNALNSLENFLNMNPNTNAILISKIDSEEYLYRGRNTLTVTRMDEVYKMDYEASTQTDHGTMRVSFNNAYYDGEVYSLNIYHPVYNTSKIGRELGFLSIIVDGEVINQIFNIKDGEMDLVTYIVDLSGNNIVCADTSLIGKKNPFAKHIMGSRGSFEQNDFLVVYEKIDNWNHYLISTIPINELLKDSRDVIFYSIIVLLLIVIFALFVGSKLVNRFYRPMKFIMNGMSRVTNGDMTARVCEVNMGNDFKEMAHGFNIMMDRIDDLMDQIKREQRQMEQIRFNALQSQIQPHFLYNTLDGIHWKALSDGNKEVSKLVKALGTYYRLCLSKGHDIISLAQEIDHVKNYLLIQDMRYPNIIESHIDITSEFMKIRIPKMTLQPLIENCIYHGIKVKEGQKGEIWIGAYKQEDKIVIFVKDSGSGMTQQEIDEINKSITIHDENFGYGVRNVNKRIEILFGKEYGLYYSKNETGGVTVEITLPGELPEG